MKLRNLRQIEGWMAQLQKIRQKHPVNANGESESEFLLAVLHGEIAEFWRVAMQEKRDKGARSEEG